MRRFPLLLLCALMLADASVCTAQIFHKKKKVDKSTDSTNTVEPDKLLYDRAAEDIKHGKHEVGRLGLQTLINTYPDSEYLAKAKLAIADSYYKEGGTSNITQAIAGYKDFIVFFPFLPEAAYAQMQVAMCNYNEMPKADRDNTHAHLAEEEFQTFLSKYPKDPLAPDAQQRLREVQEVLGEAQFRIGYYYYVKGDRRASAGRLMQLVRRYPLYSKTDTALWMLGDIFEKSERKDVAGGYYAAIVKNYPLSKYDADAKAKLVAFGVPVPQADPKAVAWMTAEQNAPRPKESLMHRGIGVFHSGPDVHTAAHNGSPQMEAENDALPGTDILGGGNRSGFGSNSIVGTVSPGQSAPAASTAGAEDAPAADTPATSEGTTAPVGGTPAADATAPGTAATTATDGTAPAGTESTSGTEPAKTDGTTTTAAPANGKESSSKKKGLKKLIPW
ncbi:MAG TPA: outer membrane protein assembly factor BamD [Candidatus Acidoferrum sp.]